MPLTGRRILLEVTGSIAAYKAADLASRLTHLGASISVVLTENAAQFVGAATFRAITANPVLTGLFEEPIEGKIAHIELAQSSDLIVVAPATANVLAKMAHGIADDLLTSLLLAATSPILVAPAMNSSMLAHPATQANMALLRDRGVGFVDPAYGVLACRTEGPGKLASVDDIVEAILARLATARDFAGIRVLVTAGATREPLDPVRFISNRSSGRMGFAVAEAAARRGAEVTVICGTVSVPPPEGVEIVEVVTTEDMLQAASCRFGECDLLVAAAAPADYSAAAPEPRKRKKEQGEWVLRLRETPDILATLAPTKQNQVMVGFAAETEALLDHAKAKLRRKQLDLIVANDVTAEGAGFEVDTNIVTLVWPDGRVDALPKMSKRAVAEHLLDSVRPLLTLAANEHK